MKCPHCGKFISEKEKEKKISDKKIEQIYWQNMYNIIKQAIVDSYYAIEEEESHNKKIERAANYTPKNLVIKNKKEK